MTGGFFICFLSFIINPSAALRQFLLRGAFLHRRSAKEHLIRLFRQSRKIHLPLKGKAIHPGILFTGQGKSDPCINSQISSQLPLGRISSDRSKNGGFRRNTSSAFFGKAEKSTFPSRGRLQKKAARWAAFLFFYQIWFFQNSFSLMRKERVRRLSLRWTF